MSANFDGALIVCLFVCFQFALVAVGVVALGNIPPPEEYYDACCVPRSCRLLSSDDLPGARTSQNLCVLAPELAGKSGCPDFAAQGGNGTCALTPGSCPKPNEADQPFGRGVLISQSVFAIFQGFLTLALAVIILLATRERAPKIPKAAGKCIGILVFSLATVASLITTISGLGIYILWGTKSIAFASEAPRTIVGAQCTYNGEPADRYVVETVPLLQTLSANMLFMSGFCLAGYVLLCCFGCILQYSESQEEKTIQRHPPQVVSGKLEEAPDESVTLDEIPPTRTSQPYRTDTE